jgi:hypothetical protein
LTEDNYPIRSRGKEERNKKETTKIRRVEEKERMKETRNERNEEINKEEKLARKKELINWRN